MLEVQHLQVEYYNPRIHRRVRVVSDVSFSLHEGEILGIVGESGAGKSTIGYAIMAALAEGGERTGKIILNGIPISTYSEVEKREMRGTQVATIVQNPFSALNPIMTLEAHFLETLEKSKKYNILSREEKLRKIFEVLEDVELPPDIDFLHRYPFQISGGQRQRVIIGLALILSPKILIADEPTTALDVFVQEQILDLIKKLIEKRHMAMILITHNMGVVNKVADDIIVMKDSKIVEMAEPSKLFQEPKEEYTQNLIKSLPPKDRTLEKIPSMRDWDTAEDLELIKKLELTEMGTQGISCTCPLELKNINFSFHKYRDFPIMNFLVHHVNNVKKIIQYKKMVAYKKFEWDNTEQILHEVSLKIKKGTALGLVGESGSGKSTIAKLIVGLLDRPTGIYYCGRELQGNEVVTDIQMIFQSPYSALNPKKTLRTIFTEAIKISRDNLTAEEVEEICRNLIQLIGLDATSLDKKPRSFSGGQLQRICIARVLILYPKLILCDEPTPSLDISVQADILNLLKYLQKHCNISMLFISHDLPVVRYMCDEIAVIKDGRIVEIQPTEDLFNNPKDAYTQKLIDLIPSIPSIP